MSEPVLGESLAVFASNWLAETTEACTLAGKVNQNHLIQNHRIGVVGQLTSPYVDIPSASLEFVNNTFSAQAPGAFFNCAGYLSAFEGGVIEQIEDTGGVSTVALLGLANDLQNRIYYATESNFLNIKPDLIGYTTLEIGEIETMLGGGDKLILPQNGGLQVEDWSGYGYLAINSTGTGLEFLIDGPLNGGRATKNGVPLDPETTNILAEIIHALSNDPIDLVTGDFLYDQTDLTVGSQPFPLGLEFKKSYNSSSRYTAGALGLGWTHNFDIRATVGSDGFQGLGKDSPIDAAAAIVGLIVSNDQLTGLTIPLWQIASASLVQRWLMDQLTDNVVSVTAPGSTSVFLQLPDGSYNPSPGSAAELFQEPDDSYQLRTKHGVEMDFNLDGTIATWEDPNLNTVSFSHSVGKLRTVSNEVGHTLTLSYDANGRIEQVSDGTRTFQYRYDLAGNLGTVTDANGEDTRFSYPTGAPGLLQSVFTPAFPTNAKVINTYNSIDQVEMQVNANGKLYQYYFAGSRSEEVDPLGNSKIAYYDEHGRTLRAIDALDSKTVFEYDGEGRVVYRLAPEGDFFEYEYDENHNLITETRFPKPGFEADDPIVRSSIYELVFNRVKTTTDPRGKVTEYFYFPNGNLERIEQPAVALGVPTTSFTYNSRGQIKTTTDPVGTVTLYAYFPANYAIADLIAKLEDYGGFNFTTRMTYKYTGDLESRTDPRMNTTFFVYDDMRRLTQTTAPLPFAYVTDYLNDEDGQVLQVDRETRFSVGPLLQTTKTTYTFSGKVKTVTDPGMHVTSFFYDEMDRVWNVVDAQMGVTTFLYDKRGNPAQVFNATNPVIPSKVTTYTANGMLDSVSDANGNTTNYSYDGFDRLVQTDFPDLSFERLQYDASSNLTQRITRASDVITYSYDDLDRLETKRLPFGPGCSIGPCQQPTTTYTYDLAGRVLNATNESVSSGYQYDALGRIDLSSQVFLPAFSPQPFSDRTYEYDENGNRKRAGDITYFYDELNRLEEVRDGLTVLAAYDYDALSRMVAVNYANSASMLYDHDIDDNLESVTHQFTGATVSFDYPLYDNLHNMKHTIVSDPSFMLDPTLPEQTVYEPNILNQYDTVSGTALFYDGSGNLSSDGGGNLNSDGGNSYVHDTQNRLTRAWTSNATISYEYDGFGRRVSRTRQVGFFSTEVTRFLNDGANVVQEERFETTVLGNPPIRSTSFDYGLRLNRPIRIVEDSISPAPTYYYHYDALGSVVALSNALGALHESYAYGPYGQVGSLGSVGNPYLYTGQEYEPDTGLYFYRNRYYSAALGRFLEPDPIGYEGGLNLYAYVGGNPINLVDPLGLSPMQFEFESIFGLGVVGGARVFAKLDAEGNFSVDTGRSRLLLGTGVALGGRGRISRLDVAAGGFEFTDVGEGVEPTSNFTFETATFAGQFVTLGVRASIGGGNGRVEGNVAIGSGVGVLATGVGINFDTVGRAFQRGFVESRLQCPTCFVAPTGF